MANRDVMERWVAALESGEYEQGTDYLHRRRETAGVDEFCCLGVLCDLAAKEGVIRPPRKSNFHDRFFYEDGSENDGRNVDAVLPATVQEWAGLNDRNEWVVEITHNGLYETLASLNDSGLSFAEIAEVIRENFLTDDEESNA